MSLLYMQICKVVDSRIVCLLFIIIEEQCFWLQGLSLCRNTYKQEAILV